MLPCLECRGRYEPPADPALDPLICPRCAARPHHAETALFVYGTLKRGGYWNKLLQIGGARFVREDVAPGYATWGDFPAAGPHPTIALEGELWDGVTPALWARLDLLERGYVPTPVYLAGGDRAVLYVARFWRGLGAPAQKWPRDANDFVT